MDAINLADVKARLSELVDRVAAGDSVELIRRGKPVALAREFTAPRKRVSVILLQSLAATMPQRSQGAANLVNSMRNNDRY